jgi:hypothetical protein
VKNSLFLSVEYKQGTPSPSFYFFKKSSNPDRGRLSCGKPCAEDSLKKAIRQERPKILY